MPFGGQITPIHTDSEMSMACVQIEPPFTGDEKYEWDIKMRDGQKVGCIVYSGVPKTHLFPTAKSVAVISNNFTSGTLKSLFRGWSALVAEKPPLIPI